MKKKALSLVLALVMCLSLIPLQAFADESTTTITASKDRNPNTEIYTVTQTPGSDYPYYGAKHEPKVGVYYGRTCTSGTKPNGQWGLLNGAEMADESAASFYYINPETLTLEYWSYIYGSIVNDGSRAFLVNLNLDLNTYKDYASGKYDNMLKSTFSYMNTLKGPTFIRIGGEMNDWCKADPQGFIAAFRHVADLAHQVSNVATVFSPNFISEYQVDMEIFYPGDAYVDWIGVSLYYEAYLFDPNATISEQDALFYGAAQYGDALLNVQQAVNLSRNHKKPLMATEGGSSSRIQDLDASAEAAFRLEKAYSFLTMVYPEIKCIIISDTNFSSTVRTYEFYNNPTVTAAYRKAIASNPTFLDKVGGTASYYTKLSAYTGAWSGKMQFAAYTYTPIPNKPTATWSVDGQNKATVSEYPYAFELDTGTLSGGKHTLTVTFDNGQSKSYDFTIAGSSSGSDTGSGTTTTFSDVPANAWYLNDLNWATSNNIVQGISATKFGPNTLCQNGQIITFLHRAAGKPSAGNVTLPFTVKNAWAEDAIKWAYSMNIIDANFDETAPCTRYTALTYIWKAFDSPASQYEINFNDIQGLDASPIAWALEKGITKGANTAMTRFNPNGTCKRSEIVAFLYRAYNNN